jgi:hypothetical protein
MPVRLKVNPWQAAQVENGEQLSQPFEGFDFVCAVACVSSHLSTMQQGTTAEKRI